MIIFHFSYKYDLYERRVEDQLWVLTQLSKTDFMSNVRCGEVKKQIENGNAQIDELFYMFTNTRDFSSFIYSLNNTMLQVDDNGDKKEPGNYFFDFKVHDLMRTAET